MQRAPDAQHGHEALAAVRLGHGDVQPAGQWPGTSQPAWGHQVGARGADAVVTHLEPSRSRDPASATRTQRGSAADAVVGVR